MDYWIERRMGDRWVRFAVREPGSSIPEETPKGWYITASFPDLDSAIEASMEVREICTGKPYLRSANDGAPWLRIVDDDGNVEWSEDIPLAGAVATAPTRLRINEFEFEEILQRKPSA